MKTILYHCSNVLIEQFDYSEGVHFGGMLSALEAGLRKEGNGVLYLHKIELETNQELYYVDDLCNKKNWDMLRHEMRKIGRTCVKYTNKYEPDSVPSYFVVDGSCVKLLSVKTVASEEAERICSLMYDFYGD